MRDQHLLPATMILVAMCAAVWAIPQAASQQSSGQAQTRPAAAAQSAAKHTPEPAAEGERIFEQNCSRCHDAPEGFSSRISGTIVRHMRVRASLSQHDERELLRYLNP